MTDILCVHQWLAGPFAPTDKNDKPWYRCKRCDGVRYEGDPEPDVVIARIR